MFISDENYFYSMILKESKSNVDELLIEKEDCYEKFYIPKKDGIRTICSIDKESTLYQLQKKLVNNFFINIPLPIPVKGFKKGESYNTFLIHHINRNYYLRLDIKNYFGSIKEQHIKEGLGEYVSNNASIIDKIIDICTLDGSLPQGAITSPILSNIIFRQVDQRIVKYCQCYGVEYTRYADDLFFSSDQLDFSLKPYFIRKIKRILREHKFECNGSKKKIDKDFISLSGYVVGDDIHLSRKKLHEINEILFFFRKNKQINGSKYEVDTSILRNPQWINDINSLALKNRYNEVLRFENKGQFINYLCGYRSFLISIIKANGEKQKEMRKLQHKISNIEKLINAICV